MLRTFPCALVLLLAGAVAVASAQQSTSHYGGGYSSRPGASISTYNPTTKTYEPVTWDKQYTYFRLKYNLEQTFFDSFRPNPTSPTLTSLVFSGNVYDNSTGVKVGTFDTSNIITLVTATTKELHYLSTMVLELGPNGDDTFLISFACDQVDPTKPPYNFDMAVTGGTGRYKGATGEVLLFAGTDDPNDTPVDTTTLYVAELAVPRFKRF